MKEQMKKIALLSLSLIPDIGVFCFDRAAIAAEHFSEYTTAQVEILISAPSFAITVMIVLNAWLSRYMKDRPMIVGGLLLYRSAAWYRCLYRNIRWCSHPGFSWGSGLDSFNAKAISILVNIMKAGKKRRCSDTADRRRCWEARL